MINVRACTTRYVFFKVQNKRNSSLFFSFFGLKTTHTTITTKKLVDIEEKIIVYPKNNYDDCIHTVYKMLTDRWPKTVSCIIAELSSLQTFVFVTFDSDWMIFPLDYYSSWFENHLTKLKVVGLIWGLIFCVHVPWSQILTGLGYSLIRNYNVC